MAVINKNNKENKKTLYSKKKYLLLSLLSLGIIAKSISNNDSDTEILDNNYEINSSLLTGAGVFGDNGQSFYAAGAIAHINQDVVYVEEPEETTEEDVSVIEPEEEFSVSTNNVYYDFPCSNEFQDYIIDISEQYGFTHKIMFTIIHQESGGGQDSNGRISKTNDYGITQINECNLDYIYQQLGYTKEEILYDPYKAVEASALLIRDMFIMYGYDYDNFDYKNIFGTYNGWINWENIEKSTRYANSCMQILEEKFGENAKTRTADDIVDPKTLKL